MWAVALVLPAPLARGQETPAPHIVSFESVPPALPAAGKVSLKWKVENAVEVSIAPKGSKTAFKCSPPKCDPADGSHELQVNATTTYVLTAKGQGKATGTKEVAIEVTPAAAASTVSNAPAVQFEVTPQTIANGERATLTWNIPNGKDVSIDPDFPNQPSQGSKEVHPTASTTYTLTAKLGGKVVKLTTAVTVAAARQAEQTFTLPEFSDSSGGRSAALPLALVILFCVLALLLQVMAMRKLRAAPSPEPGVDLQPLQSSLAKLQEQAALASRRYDAAFAAAARPPSTTPPPPPPRTTVPPEPPFRPVQSTPIRPAEPTWQPEPVRTTPAPAASTDSGLVSEYQRVRSSANRDRDVDAFEAKYRYTRISCVNFDDLRYNPNATLRFEESQRGWIFMVRQGLQIVAFPWFATDLNQERDRLEGIFQYPPSGSASRIAQPAILEPRGAEFVMTKPGVLDANG
ncbi:MAG: hypothetical protein ACLP59_10705 [Bryobacteraceae bacterium]